MTNLKYFLSISKLLKNKNISQLRTGENLTTALYSKTIKPEFFLHETETTKKAKITKQANNTVIMLKS